MLNDSIKTGLARLAHLRERNEAKADEMAAQRSRFGSLSGREPVRAISAFNLFQTPAQIAERMASMLGCIDDMRCLEPSAGLGRLYHAGCTAGDAARWVLVERSADCCGELYKSCRGALILQRDFLEQQELGTFDRVLMNPPFKQGRDIKHTIHAHSMLRDGGLLVGLVFNGVRQNRKLRPLVDTWEVLPADSFKSEGTKASVALITWRKGYE